MSIAGGLMLRDLARQAQSADAQLGTRGNDDPSVLAEYEYFSRNGITRADYAEGLRVRDRHEFEARVTADLEGEPPANTLSDTVCALSDTPHRARLERYIAWRAAEAVKLTELEQRRDELLGLKARPAETESKIKAAIRKTADYLMGRSDDGGDELDRKGLEERLAIERHRAQAVDLILPDLERQIEIATIRVERLQGREADFVRPALLEHVEQYGAEYVRAVDALRKAIAPLAGLNAYLGRDGANVQLPGFGIVSDKKLLVKESDSKPWDKLAIEWGATPRARPSWIEP